MIRLLIALLGCACGALAGLYVLLGEPLDWLRVPPAVVIPDAEQLVVIGTAGRGVPADPAGVLGLGAARGQTFTDNALRYARVDLALLSSPDTSVRALGVKFATTDAGNNLLRRRLYMDTAWNLAWPGHGSLFLVGKEDFRPRLAGQVWSKLRRNESETAPGVQALTTATWLRGGGGRLLGIAGNYMEYWSPETGVELELGLTAD